MKILYYGLLGAAFITSIVTISQIRGGRHLESRISALESPDNRATNTPALTAQPTNLDSGIIQQLNLLYQVN